MATVQPFDERELITGSGLPMPVVRPTIQNSTVHGPDPGCNVAEFGTFTTPFVALNERAGLGPSSRSPPPAVPAATPVNDPTEKSAWVVSVYDVAFIVAVRSSSCGVAGVNAVVSVSRTLKVEGAVFPVFAPTAWMSVMPRLKSLNDEAVKVGPPKIT